MAQPTFDVFSGTPGQNALLIEAVEGLSNARERMQQIANNKPGKYFLFSPTGHSVLAEIETFKEMDSSKAQTARS